MTKLTLLIDALQYDVEERFIVETKASKPFIDKLIEMGLVAFWDGVYWLTYDGEAYARGELC